MTKKYIVKININITLNIVLFWAVLAHAVEPTGKRKWVRWDGHEACLQRKPMAPG